MTRHPRKICLAVLAAGLTLGGLRRDAASAPRPTAGGYTVLAGDFHVHGSPDGIPPWDAAREARRRRLDVIALTSHNSLRGWWLWRHLPQEAGDVMVLPGEELTAVGYHMAIVGLDRPIPWRLRARDAAAAAHEQHAVAILAHPDSERLLPFVTDDDLRAMDGIEFAHPPTGDSEKAHRQLAEFYWRVQALKPVAAIGSSDFHYFAPIGASRTYLFVRDTTPAGVLDAIRSLRTVACNDRGEVVGPSELAALVAARCRDDAAAPALGSSAASRFGAWISWLAMAALVWLGAPRAATTRGATLSRRL